mmetsp:Transcript_41522/g.125832  ORF Transcript_41522/g.125832 Transcript_41522/m.125832 type:complete len:235 (-) Transcript_41522:955-1659(-)
MAIISMTERLGKVSRHVIDVAVLARLSPPVVNFAQHVWSRRPEHVEVGNQRRAAGRHDFEAPCHRLIERIENKIMLGSRSKRIIPDLPPLGIVAWTPKMPRRKLSIILLPFFGENGGAVFKSGERFKGLMSKHIHIHIEAAQDVDGRETEYICLHDRPWQALVDVPEHRVGKVFFDELQRLLVIEVQKGKIRVQILEGLAIKLPILVERRVRGCLYDNFGHRRDLSFLLRSRNV